MGDDVGDTIRRVLDRRGGRAAWPVPIRSGRRSAALLALCSLPLAGCGLAAAPCRVGSAVLKIVPVAGSVAAAPTDACADVIDPTPTRS